MSPIIVSVVNHKGGVAKTALTVNLGAALARRGKKVLLVDVDAQQNLTHSLLGALDFTPGDFTLYEAMMQEQSLDQLIQSTNEPGLDVIPCKEDFAQTDISLVSAVGRETVLKECLAKTSALDNYDFVLIDNPPSISLVVVNSLVASRYYLVPVSADYLPMVGLGLLAQSINKLEKIAPELELLGVVLTMYSRNERICRHVESTLTNQLPDMIFNTKIRTNTKFKAAPSVRKTIFEYENSEKGRGTEDFFSLADELLVKLDELSQPTMEAAVNG